MTYTLAYELDKDASGAIRKTRGGDYRFSVIIKAEDDSIALLVKGFRVDSRFMRVISPVSLYQNKSYNIVILGSAQEQALIADIKARVGGNFNG